MHVEEPSQFSPAGNYTGPSREICELGFSQVDQRRHPQGSSGEASQRKRKKNDWTGLVFNQIDFSNYGKLQKKRTVPHRVRSSKVMYGKLPTLVRLKEMFPEKYEVTTGPCCGNREEPNDHLWACKSTELETVVKEGLLALARGRNGEV
jgi:hypothetical protein